MKEIASIMITALLLQGCIFTPPAQSTKTWSQVSAREDVIDISDSDPILRFAKNHIGIPYRYGGMSPRGFDCSGFVCYVYEQGVGKKLPRTARAQSLYGHMLDKEELLPGDLLFFDTSNGGRINHSGIYLGGGKFIHASSGKVYSVTISKLNSGFYQRAFRWGGRVNY